MEGKSLNQLWGIIKEVLAESNKPYENMNAVYEFNITDQDETYQLAFSEGSAKISDSSEQEADCTLSMKEADFKKLLLGKLNSTMAFMTGKLKVKGNIQQALALEKLLKQYDLSKK